MNKHTQVFLDIDTQFDFMHPKGQLYVPDAETIEPQLKKLLAYARKKQIPILASVDAHTPNDPEFIHFPPHCIKGTPGQEKILATQNQDTQIIGPQKQSLDLSGLNHVVLEKSVFDIFANANTDSILRETGAVQATVFGVATDYCVKAAVLGLLERGLDVTVVSDAIKAVSYEGHQQTMQMFLEKGVHLKNTAEVIGE